MPVFTPDYRKAPEFKHPAAVEDCVAALRYVATHAPDGTRRAASRVFVVGDSSGGGLAAATLLAAQEQEQGLAGIPVSGMCSISGWLDMSCRGSTYRTRKWKKKRRSGDPIFNSGQPREERKGTLEMVYDYLGTVDTAATEQPTASPIFAEPTALSSLPPALIIVGDEEVVLEDSTRWAEALDAAGVAVGLEVYPRMWHDVRHRPLHHFGPSNLLAVRLAQFVMYSEGCGGDGAKPLEEAAVALRHVAEFFRQCAAPGDTEGGGALRPQPEPEPEEAIAEAVA